MLETADPSRLRESAPAWELDWLTPLRCRVILAAVLLAGVLAHLAYLHYDCPLDLSGDEAHYWDWSRGLEISYYSKGPLVAYLIRASCAIFGDTMPAVRYPAILLGAATSIAAYALVRVLFGSDRMALGAVLLFHVVPLFIAGSIIMTIDPPMFFCWALATLFAAGAIFQGRPRLWPLVGMAIGLGFLAKYAAFLWFVGLFAFIFVHPAQRRHLIGALVSLAVALPFTFPVILWNARHDWVSFRHVSTQIGAGGGGFTPRFLPELIAGQIGVLGPTMAVLVVAALVHAMSPRLGGPDPDRDKSRFLAWLGFPFLIIVVIASLRTRVQQNWPAPAYFTLVIVVAAFLATRVRSADSWKRWRGWLYATIVIGLLAAPVLHDLSMLYPIIQKANAVLGTHYDPSRADFTARLRGWAQLGGEVSEHLRTLAPGAFVLCSDYQQTAEMAFYVDGQSVTYCASAHLGRRMSQYDMWDDRRLDSASPLIGRDAVYLGKSGGPPAPIVDAFEVVETLPDVMIEVRGVVVQRFRLWRCRGFKGMPSTGEMRSY